MFVLHALTSDTRFRDSLTYVEATIQTFQRDTRSSPITPFPLDLEIDEIAVTIDEHSDVYTLGDKTAPLKVMNPYARTDTMDAPVIRALGHRDNKCSPQTKSTYTYNDKKEDRSGDRNTQTYKVCMGVCHCITNPDAICFIVTKAHVSNRYIEDTSNTQIVKSNAYRYRKHMKDKAQRNKASKRNGVIRWLEDNGHT